MRVRPTGPLVKSTSQFKAKLKVYFPSLYDNQGSVSSLAPDKHTGSFPFWSVGVGCRQARLKLKVYCCYFRESCCYTAIVIDLYICATGCTLILICIFTFLCSYQGRRQRFCRYDHDLDRISHTRCNFSYNLCCNVGKRNPLQIVGSMLHFAI